MSYNVQNNTQVSKLARLTFENYAQEKGGGGELLKTDTPCIILNVAKSEVSVLFGIKPYQYHHHFWIPPNTMWGGGGGGYNEPELGGQGS